MYLSTLLIFAVTLWSSTAASTDIFKWVDEDGLVHFSDNPPANAEDVKTLHLNNSNPPDYDPADDPYSITNQSKRMNEKWTQLTKERGERAAERREQVELYARYAPSHYYGWRYGYRPGYYPPTYPVRPPPHQFRTVRRQVQALDTLNLSGPRPYSINSGAHAARVESSNNFLSSVPKPAPR